jgi:hypothetical protein
MINPEAFYDKEPITIFPTAGGGHNWAPMSFSSRHRPGLRSHQLRKLDLRRR